MSMSYAADDPHAGWALEGQPDAGPDPLPRMCMYCKSYLSLDGLDAGICDHEFDSWARQWRHGHPNGNWRQAVDAAEIWMSGAGVVYADEDPCDSYEEVE